MLDEMINGYIGKVKSKTGGAELRIFPNNKVNASCVEHLEHMLKQAKEGEIKAIACAIDYGTGTGHAFSDMPNQSAMLGAIEHLKYRILKQGYE